MNEGSSLGTSRLSARDLESLQESRLFLIGMGIALIVLGALAMGSSFITTLATVLVFGLLLLLGAAFQTVTAFWARRWKGFALHLVAGVLYFIAGVFLIENPMEGALGLTLLVAACLLGGGTLRVILSLVERFDGWGWVLLNGIVSVLLGAAIWMQWPLSGLWIIGLFVGIEMLLSGVSWLMLGLAIRSTPKVALPT
jgi:uncharacterized membrane protein HdeD (DUF308 family)